MENQRTRKQVHSARPATLVALTFLATLGVGCKASIFANHNLQFKTCIKPTTEPLKEPRVSARDMGDDDTASCLITVEVPKDWRCWTDEAHMLDVKDAYKSHIGWVHQPLCHHGK